MFIWKKRPYQYLWGVWIRRFCFITSNMENLNRIYWVFPTWGTRTLYNYPKHPKAMYWIGHCKPSKKPNPLNPFWRILILTNISKNAAVTIQRERPWRVVACHFVFFSREMINLKHREKKSNTKLQVQTGNLPYVHDTLTMLLPYSHDTPTILSRYSHSTLTILRYSHDTIAIPLRYSHDILTVLSWYFGEILETVPQKLES